MKNLFLFIVIALPVCIINGFAIHNMYTGDYEVYEAKINEYEFILADVWQEKEHCKQQLGVFYKED